MVSQASKEPEGDVMVFGRWHKGGPRCIREDGLIISFLSRKFSSPPLLPNYGYTMLTMTTQQMLSEGTGRSLTCNPIAVLRPSAHVDLNDMMCIYVCTLYIYMSCRGTCRVQHVQYIHVRSADSCLPSELKILEPFSAQTYESLSRIPAASRL